MSRTLSTRTLLFLGALYLAQGLPYGFFQQALPVLMRDRGFSLEQIGFASLLALPWALKFLWAPLVDRFYWPRLGRRRSWLLPLQVLMGLSLLGMAWLPPERSFAAVLVGVLWINFLCATQDIPADGLAVEVIPAESRGLGNGVQVGGYRLGMILSGGALLSWYARLGWAWSFVGMGLLVLATALPTAMAREPARAPAPSAKAPARHFLRVPGAWGVIGLLVVYKFGEHFATGMLRPFLRDQKLSLDELGLLLGTAGSLCGLLGAFLGGVTIDRLGRRRALLLCGLLQAGAVLGYAWLASGALSWGALYAVVGLEHLCGGMATAALFACMMDFCRPGHEGADYTTQASAVVIASGLAASVSGLSAGRLGYQGHFVLAAILAFFSVVWVWYVGEGRSFRQQIGRAG